MSSTSTFVQVRSMRYAEGDVRKGCFVWCPGCARHHVFMVEGGTSVWEWDGNLEKPTFSPSYLEKGGSSICHSYLQNGRWQFLPDSTHALAGQTVDMVPLPIWLIKDPV